ncbi:MAG: tRNA-dihydrouridine synthase family protein [Candidatus Nanoarchaeia archaeon]|nr:tRNA-dihydrouridine synthase family protein [Candidatus Nanoarchaeia archaeon]
MENNNNNNNNNTNYNNANSDNNNNNTNNNSANNNNDNNNKCNKYNIKNKILLAPMEDITNISYRILALRKGVDLTFTEMIPADFIVKAEMEKSLIQSKIYEKLKTNKEDKSFVQIFGNDANIIAKAASILEKEDFEGIDINMGCPALKIVKNNSGSKILTNLELLEEILSKTRNAIKKPLSVKIRLGFEEENYLDVIKIAEKYVDFITIHARLRTQGYSGTADWDAIKKAKSISKVPIVGNGDVKSIEDAKKKIKEGYCDAVMIGRESYRNMNLFEGKNQITKEESKELIMEYYELWKKYSPDDIFKLRFFIQWTYKTKNIKDLRREINFLKDEKEIMNLLEKY